MIDVDVNKFLYGFSVISYFIDFLHALRKVICMALGCSSSLPSSSSSSSSSWISCFQSSSSSPIFFPKGMTLSFNSKHYSMDNNNSSFYKTISKGLPIILEEELPKQNFICSKIEHKEAKDQFVPPLHSGEYPSENSSILMQERLLDSRAATSLDIGKVKLSSKIKKRPARLVVPESFSGLDVCEVANHEPSQKEFEIEGKDFTFASRRGRRLVMEDGYQVITDIMGDSQQAFFGVFDGHGGRAAVDFVTENLGKKIVAALREVEETKDQSREAIKKGYLATDTEFLSQDVSSGACAATVIMKDGEMYIANVGDCRVVLSRKGISTALTSDHRLDREDERLRIDSLGGYVNCQNGVWRVQGSLAVSRAIGDSNLKQWVVSEPEIKKLEITSDCEFLVLASDGLWDKVSNQEAVDIVSGQKNSIESCKKLVDISFSRGSKDDISVMVIDLQNFKRQKENQSLYELQERKSATFTS